MDSVLVTTLILSTAAACNATVITHRRHYFPQLAHYHSTNILAMDFLGDGVSMRLLRNVI